MSSEHLRPYKSFIDPRGYLGVVDDRDIPFKIKRIFWIQDVPEGKSRGHHSHKDCEQVIICLTGSFMVRLDSETFFLNRSSEMLYAPAGCYIILNKFSEDAVCLVLASEYYESSIHQSQTGA